MKRIALAVAMAGALALGAPGGAQACEMTSQCSAGNHADCPYALGSTEDFDCACPCHDAMFELEIMELGL